MDSEQLLQQIEDDKEYMRKHRRIMWNRGFDHQLNSVAIFDDEARNAYEEDAYYLRGKGAAMCVQGKSMAGESIEVRRGYAKQYQLDANADAGTDI